MTITFKSLIEFREYVRKTSNCQDVRIDVAWQEPFTLLIERCEKIERVKYYTVFYENDIRQFSFDKEELDEICSRL